MRLEGHSSESFHGALKMVQDSTCRISNIFSVVESTKGEQESHQRMHAVLGRECKAWVLTLTFVQSGLIASLIVNSVLKTWIRARVWSSDAAP